MNKIVSVSEEIENILEDEGLGLAVSLSALRKTIHRILGGSLMTHVRLLGLKNGTLYMGVPDSNWAMELSFMKEQLIRALKQSNVQIKDIRFKEIPNG